MATASFLCLSFAQFINAGHAVTKLFIIDISSLKLISQACRYGGLYCSYLIDIIIAMYSKTVSTYPHSPACFPSLNFSFVGSIFSSSSLRHINFSHFQCIGSPLLTLCNKRRLDSIYKIQLSEQVRI
ncbi:hypothetical protein F4604DRAFT_758602 [Suillus subluteus]|nr:hypothetical protein F4604DRAFT_758602 [Suillus subluteus]